MIELFSLKKKFARMARLTDKNNLLGQLACVRIGPEGFAVGNLVTNMIVPSDTGLQDDILVEFATFQKIVKTAKKSVELSTPDERTLSIRIDEKKSFSVPIKQLEHIAIVESDSYLPYNTMMGEALIDLSTHCGNDEFREAMQGIFLGRDHTVATDAHTVKFLKNDKEHKTKEVIIPNIGKFIDPKKEYQLRVGTSGTYSRIEGDDEYFTVSNISERFPDYKAIIPQSFKYTIKVNRLAFIDAVSSAMLVANKTTNAVLISTNDTKGITIVSEDLDFDTRFTQDLECALSGDWAVETIALNGNLVARMVKEKKEDIVFEVAGRNRAIIINGNSLLMPVRYNIP